MKWSIPQFMVILDDRERTSGLHEAIARVCGCEPKIERLEVGDILVGGRYLIERKEAADFQSSIIDGRLFRQAAELAGQKFEPLVIVEGEFAKGEDERLTPAAIRGAMLSLALDWRIPILRARSIQETAFWVLSLIERMRKHEAAPDWRGVTPTGERKPSAAVLFSRPRRKEVAPELRERRRQLNLLRQIPGIGNKRALALLEKMGSFQSVVTRSVEELATLDGIGIHLAREIHRVLHGEAGTKR